MKAILVIDKPRYCEECSLCCRDSEEGYFCPVNIEADTLNTYGEEDPRYHTIRKGCPLKEMPQKKDTSPNGSTSYKQTVELARRVGWNECLEELEK